MAMRNQTSNVYTEWQPLIDSLPDKNAGIIFKNLLNYQNGDDITDTNPIWIFIKAKLDEYNLKGENISKSRAEIGRLGGLAKASKSKQTVANDGKPSNKRKEKKIKQNKIEENRIKDINVPYLGIVERYKTLIESYLGKDIKVNKNEWAKEFRLCEKEQGITEFQFMLDWYAKNISKEYIPECYSAKTFRDKFADKLIPAVKRNQSKDNTSAIMDMEL